MDVLGAKARLTDLAESVSDRLTLEQRGWLGDLLRAGEVEVGLEMLADWLAEDEHPLSAEERREALALAEELGVPERVGGALAFCPERP